MEFDLSVTWTIVLAVLVAWDWVWRGLALWRAGRNDQPGWFVALLVLNTVGILPIIYLLVHRKRES